MGGRRHRLDPWARKTPLEEGRATTQVFLPGESQGQRGLAGNGPQDHRESGVTEVT